MKITAVEEAALLQIRVAGAALLSQHQARYNDIDPFADDYSAKKHQNDNRIFEHIADLKTNTDALENLLRQVE